LVCFCLLSCSVVHRDLHSFPTRRSSDLGMMYLVIVGFSVNIKGFLTSAATITLFCLCVIAGSLLLHVLITRLLKIRYEYVLLGIVGAIADGTTSSLVASGARWKSLVSVGML